MERESQKSKVYLEIVHQLRQMIDKDGLKAGDKIPSERELSERLNAGRSSVREALRALELLGLIETRRGEGTFIRDFRGNQLVQLLGTFVLQDRKAIADVLETKCLIELDSLRIALAKNSAEEFARLKEWVEGQTVTNHDFFVKIAAMADNHLVYRIWQILENYYHSIDMEKPAPSKDDYLELVDALAIGEMEKVERVYYQLRKLS